MFQKNNSNLLYQSIFWLYIIFFVSIIFPLRPVSSITIVLILIIGIIKTKKERNYFFSNEIINPFFIGCIGLYVLKCFSLFYTEDVARSIKDLKQSSGLVLVPLAVYSSRIF